MQKYANLIKNLTKVLNQNRSLKNQDIGKEFKNILIDFKTYFKTELSTKFLKNLIKNKDNRNKTYRLKYLLKISGLKTQKQNRYFKTPIAPNFKKDIVEYITIPFNSVKKENLFNIEEINQYEKIIKPYDLTEAEKQQLKEIEEIKINSGVALYPKALKENEAKNKKKKAFYNESLGFVKIKKITTQNVGLSEFRANTKEVLFNIVGF